MPILTGDILQHLSTEVGSTGGTISGSTVTSGVINNVWPDITDAERQSGGEVFRKTFWKNNSATDPMLLPVMFAPILPSGMTLALGLGFDDAADNDAGQGNMIAFDANALVALVSDGIDTRGATIYGVDDADAPVSEAVVLNGATEVVSVGTFAKVWGVYLDGTSVDRTVEVRQGAGGTLRGSIGPNKVCCWLWVDSPSTKASGIALPDLGAGQNYGMWRRLSWLADASPVRPNSMTVSIEEA